MATAGAESIALRVSESQSVSGLVLAPARPQACFVFAHGAGAGMAHSFMASFALGLAERSVATVRYQFPYMESGSKRPDTPDVAHAAVRAAVADARQRFEGLPLIAGGKSFGARMSSQAQAKDPMPGVAGLAFVGFPLHPAGKPSVQRAEHLAGVNIPMLFLQGTRDELAELQLLAPVVEGLRPLSTLLLFDDADHSFHVRVRSSRTDAQVMAAMLDAFVEWTNSLT
ncbi:MAG: alpha/beta family hydrolase [Burkholderiaceae bacterium]